MTFPLGLLEYWETNATLNPIEEKTSYIQLKLLRICQSTSLNEQFFRFKTKSKQSLF